MFDPLDCPKCADHYYTSPFLVEAAASVGIERGMSTQETLRRYLADYHRNRHPVREIRDGETR